MKSSVFIVFILLSLTACKDIKNITLIKPNNKTLSPIQQERLELISNAKVKDTFKISELGINIPKLNTDFPTVLIEIENNDKIRHYPYSSKLLIEELSKDNLSNFSMIFIFEEGRFTSAKVLTHSQF